MIISYIIVWECSAIFTLCFKNFARWPDTKQLMNYDRLRRSTLSILVFVIWGGKTTNDFYLIQKLSFFFKPYAKFIQHLWQCQNKPSKKKREKGLKNLKLLYIRHCEIIKREKNTTDYISPARNWHNQKLQISGWSLYSCLDFFLLRDKTIFYFFFFVLPRKLQLSFVMTDTVW